MLLAQSFRVVESPPEASLHPRAIWRHWQTHVIWDPRTYYGTASARHVERTADNHAPLRDWALPTGLTQLIGLVIVLFSSMVLANADERRRRGLEVPFAGQYLLVGLYILVIIAPLHWYSTHRSSSHILTRTRTHIILLLGLAAALLVFEIRVLLQIDAGCGLHTINCETDSFFAGLISVAPVLCLLTAYILFSNARARIHPLIAELPYAVEDENGRRNYAGDWAIADVSEGILDDSPEPAGEIVL